MNTRGGEKSSYSGGISRWIRAPGISLRLDLNTRSGKKPPLTRSE